jgi:hypothetical protein
MLAIFSINTTFYCYLAVLRSYFTMSVSHNNETYDKNYKLIRHILTI